jgi:hypothetical protein
MWAAIIGLIGVVLGFCLSAGYAEWKSRQNRKEMKAGLLEELRANLQMVPQKRDIFEKIIANLNDGIKDRGQIFYFDISFFIHIYLSNLKI